MIKHIPDPFGFAHKKYYWSCVTERHAHVMYVCVCACVCACVCVHVGISKQVDFPKKLEKDFPMISESVDDGHSDADNDDDADKMCVCVCVCLCVCVCVCVCV